jgi:hypothetical protein
VRADEMKIKTVEIVVGKKVRSSDFAFPLKMPAGTNVGQ